MTRLRFAWMLVGLGAAVSLGCVPNRHAQIAQPPMAERLAPELPVVAPSDLEPDRDRLPSFRIDNPPEQPTPHQYRGLTERDAQCLAVAASETGNLLIDENAAQGPPPDRHLHRAEAKAQRQYHIDLTARQLASDEARNRDAAVALEMFFQLARAEASLAVLRESRVALNDFREQAKKADDSGLPLPEGISVVELERRAIKLEETIVEAELAVATLNAELERRLGLTLQAGERLWPVRRYHVPITAIDVAAATRAGLTHRAELQLLRFLLSELDADTLGTVRSFLESVNALLGDNKTASLLAQYIPLLKRRVEAEGEAEVQARQVQLQNLLGQRERLVAQEVRQAVGSLEGRGKLVALASARVESFREQRERVADEVEKGVSSSFELSGVTLQWIQARADLIEAVTEWELARVQLKLAQGAFVLECR